jgi:hypothetical protein
MVPSTMEDIQRISPIAFEFLAHVYPMSKETMDKLKDLL